MDPSEVLIFRDYSGWEEPALSTPFGFWSLRNIVVLGIMGMVSAALYYVIVPDNLDFGRDWAYVCAALSPLGFGVILGSARTPLATADSAIIALLLLACRSLGSGSGSGSGSGGRAGGRGGRGSPRRKRKKSHVLGFPRNLPPPRGAVSPDERPLEIICADFDEIKSIRVTIYGGDGTAYGNRLVSCYLDDELVDTVRTSAGGVLVLNVRPEREGGRRLLVREYAEADPATDGAVDGLVLLSKPIHFMRGGGGAGATAAAATAAAVEDL